MYCHSRYAGNPADVWKHFWLCEVVSRLRPDSACRVTVLDTHCGTGMYYRSEAAEWDVGIGRFGRTAAASLGRFGRILGPCLEWNQYLGSWPLAALVLEDRRIEYSLVGCDISEDVRQACRSNAGRFARFGRCQFICGNGYTIAERGPHRSLVFLDPPNLPGRHDDWAALTRLIPILHAKTDVVAAWYPIYDDRESEQFLHETDLIGHEIDWRSSPDRQHRRMTGCGFAIGTAEELDLAHAERLAQDVAYTLGGRYLKREGQHSLPESD